MPAEATLSAEVLHKEPDVLAGNVRPLDVRAAGSVWNQLPVLVHR